MSGATTDEEDGSIADLDAPPSDDESMLGLLGPVARAPSARPPVDLSAGTVVDGTYRIIRQLGAGGMGVVYLARDVELQRDVALKIHRASHGLDRLQREAVAMAQLAHPNVLTVHAVGRVQDRLYIAMEYVPGATLRTWLEVEPRPWRQVLALMVSAGDGLAAAHDAGFVHRDFKPDNVLVGRDGRPRVGDFGLVRVASDALTSSGTLHAADSLVDVPISGSIEEAALAETIDQGPRRRVPAAESAARPVMTPPLSPAPGPNLTATGAAMGTPAYMAPEQFAGGDVDARADQFAFCIVLYEALCGRRPFRGATYAELRAAVDREPVPLPRGRAPTWLWRVLRRGLARDPSARWPDMRSLLAALRGGPRRRTVTLVAALSAAVLAGGAGWVATRPTYGMAAPPSCRTASALIDEVWNPERAGQLAARFLELDPIGGASFADRTGRNIDAWVGRYRTVTEQACRASRIKPISWTTRTAAASVGCTRKAAQALHAGVARAMRAERELLPSITADARSPFPVEDCLDERLLLADYQVPLDRAEAARVAAMVEQLYDLDDEVQTGLVVEARRRFDALWPEVERLQFKPLTAQALRVDGSIAMAEHRLDVAAERFQAAYAEGRAASADGVALSAAALLIWVTGVELQQVDAARPWIAQAVPEAERYGLRHHAAAGVLHSAAVVAEIDADYDRAIELNRKLVEAVRGVDDIMYAQTLAALGTSLDAGGRSQEALDAYAEALAIYERDYGREHPATVPLRSNIVVAKIAVGDVAGGLAVAEEAIALLDRIALSDPFEGTALRFNYAHALQASGRLAEAAAGFLQVRADYAAAGGEDSPDVADVDANLGHLYIRLGRTAEARHHLEHALAVRRALFGDDHDLVADVYTHLGDLARSGGGGGCAKAIPQYERAIASFQAVAERGGVVLDRMAGPQISLGRCRFEAGRVEEAITLLTEARRIAQAPSQQAEATLSLGWALVAAHRDADARPLLTEARGQLDGDDAESVADREKIDRWLAAHP